MKLAPKLILLFRDSDGFGSSIANALHPKPESALTREESSFELPLDKYGVPHGSVSGDLVQFMDPAGSPQVSILIVPNYAPPIAACAMNEILSVIASQENSTKPTLIVPLISKSLITPDFTLFGTEVGDNTDFSRGLIEKLAKLSPTGLRIDSEPVACLLQMVPVLNLSTVLLIASTTQLQSRKSSNFDHEAICHLGDYLGSRIDLEFNKKSLKVSSIEKGRAAQEPWRELYG